MGGYGSGRPRERYSVDECQVLDANQMNRIGHLPIPPADEIWIQVRVRDSDGNWQTVTQYIRVERVPRRFGEARSGTRHHFRCWCDRRAVKLYQRGCGFYRCRRCLHLAYPCEREDALDRALRRIGKIQVRLGGDPDPEAPFPVRPKDMHRRTYERFWYRFLEAEQRALEAAAHPPPWGMIANRPAHRAHRPSAPVAGLLPALPAPLSLDAQQNAREGDNAAKFVF